MREFSVRQVALRGRRRAVRAQIRAARRTRSICSPTTTAAGCCADQPSCVSGLVDRDIWPTVAIRRRKRESQRTVADAVESSRVESLEFESEDAES